MTILVDIDATIANTGEVLLKWLNHYNFTQYKYDEIATYDWFDKTFDNPFKFLSIPQFWDEVEIDKKAVEVLQNRIKVNKDKVYIVTASYANNPGIDAKLQKVLSAFDEGLIGPKQIIIAHDKNMVKGDVLVDDCVDHLQTFDKNTICFSQPWNKDYTNCGFKADDWTKVDKVLTMIKNTIYMKNKYFN